MEDNGGKRLKLSIEVEENSSEKKDVLTFAALPGHCLKAYALPDSTGSFSSPQRIPNLINSMLREMESDLCSKEATLQETFSKIQ